MAAIAFILHPDGRPVTPDDVAAPFAALGHRGPDGGRVERIGACALGHHHFWTTPEEVGERQPLAGAGPAGESLRIAFDGRLDNRDEVRSALGEGPLRAGAAPSDAALALAAFARWGEDCFARLLGPFAAVVVDLRARRAILARDPVGDRGLVYHRGTGLFLAASEEAAVLAHPAVPDGVDEETVARFLALAPPAPGRTFCTGIAELPPGHLMVVPFDGAAGAPRAFWRWAGAAAPGRRPDREWVEAFRDTLAASVRCRMRAPVAPPVLMSGGLDSTSVAVLAASDPAGRGAGPLRTLSWVFDELSGADERAFMEPVVAATGARATWIRGDDAWPLRDLETWPVSPGAPYAAIYRRLRERAYAAAAAGGARSILTGECGDQLFFGASRWLRDLLAEGRWLTAAGGLAREAALGRRRDLPRAGLRGAVGRAVGWRPRPLPPPPWLAPRGLELAGGVVPAPDPGAVGARRPEQQGALLAPQVAGAIQVEAALAAARGMEVRRPYRDRRLIELALALPAHLLYRPGWHKWITREATRGLLPEAVRLRRRRTSLYPLFQRGLLEREADTVRALLDDPDAWWPRYVRRDWLRGFLGEGVPAGTDGPPALAAWHCIALELWRLRREGRSAPAESTGRLVC